MIRQRHDGDRHRRNRNCPRQPRGASRAPPDTLGSPVRSESLERGVVQQHQRQPDCQQIEEGIVARQRDQFLKRDQHHAGSDADPTRPEDAPWNDQLEAQHDCGRRFVEPDRQLRNVERQRRGQRLRLVVNRQGRQAFPRGIAAGQLHDPGSKYQPEQQPPDQPSGYTRWIGRFADAIPPRQRRERDREQPGFQQQRVPLIRQEIAAHERQRQVGDPQGRQDHRGSDANHLQRGQDDAGDAQRIQKAIARGQLGELYSGVRAERGDEKELVVV